jgi:broad specificity phosphatase PhoE
VQVQQQPLPPDSEDINSFWERVEQVYLDAVESLEQGTVCVVAHAAVHAALICRCLGLSVKDVGKFRMSTAGVTVIEFPYDKDIGIVRCDPAICYGPHSFAMLLGLLAIFPAVGFSQFLNAQQVICCTIRF